MYRLGYPIRKYSADAPGGIRWGADDVGISALQIGFTLQATVPGAIDIRPPNVAPHISGLSKERIALNSFRTSWQKRPKH